jgi:predicted transcriptional regulator
MNETSQQIELTAKIVSTFVAHNRVPRGELPALLDRVHEAIKCLAAGAAALAPAATVPAAPPDKSIFKDHIVCLEDGAKFKSLKRHLRASHQLTPEQYRKRWGLPVDYPMVAPEYAAARSALATTTGLGRRRGPWKK